MKLYFPKSHYRPDRRSVFPLLRPFIKGEGFTDADRIALYGVSERDFEFTEHLEDADLAIVTMAWNFYVKTGQTELAINFVKECNVLGKKVIAVNTEDFGMRIPHLENLVILRYSGYKSKFRKNEYVQPPFIKDPLFTFFRRETIIERFYSPQPVVGFCGQADSSWLNAIKEIFVTAFRNLKFYIGLSHNEPQQLISSTFLRAAILKNIQKSPHVVSNFILRKKYRAGVIANKDTHQTTLEFYDNLKNSDYVVCLRGAGNFSIRFYETLAMGRIPVFINTDCALPFDKEIDWKKHVVWVEYKERHKVTEKVRNFHDALSEKDFIGLQYANRMLWEERLTLRGFFKNMLQEKFVDPFNKII